ncbi:hypothetical protein BURCENBC7_AP7938 [Burkholderia cenocepacia BC7]|nr:hypothetical protein BURCENK562V_C6839 [Burkholderia cenocepacia K56-2Valvano]ERI29312.1 hypothetical protein BURCENBC7_AP7938 [Burkholderia cenocepacia BC7]
MWAILAHRQMRRHAHAKSPCGNRERIRDRTSNPCLRSFICACRTLARQGSAGISRGKTKVAQDHPSPPRFTQAAIWLHGTHGPTRDPRHPSMKRKARRTPRHASRCVSARTTHASR